MFEHVTILLSFVYAVALTHLLSSATGLLIAGKRVRFSGLYAVWLVLALFAILMNWLAVWSLVALKWWSVAEVTIQFLCAVTQYFTCSTFQIAEMRGDETIDLPALYQQRRPLIFAAFLALSLIGGFENWWDRNNTTGLPAGAWIGEDLSIVPMGIAVIVAGWARPLWLQWAAAALMASLIVFVLVTYAPLPAG
jgi:hypothetical protein